MKFAQSLLPTSRNHWLLSGGTLIDSFGFGLFVTTGTVYFTHWVHLSAAQVGFGMSLAGLVGFTAAIPSGHLADRYGPRRAAVVLALAQAGAMAAYLVIHSFLTFLVITSLFTCVEKGGTTARQALVGRLFTESSKVTVQAYLRSVLNVGISVGTLVGGAVLQVDHRVLYLVLIGVNAMSFAVLAALTALLPATSPLPALTSTTPEPTVLRDVPYLSVGLLNGALSLHASILMVGVPLWVTLHTHAPPATIAVLFLSNTLLAIALQVRASRGSGTVGGAARTIAASSLASAAACLLFAPTSQLPGLAALAVLFFATVALTAGELLQSAGGWGLSFGLAPERGQGTYLGAFSMGYALRDGLGPIIVTSVAISHGAVGWIVLCAMFLALGAAAPPITRWAISSRRPSTSVRRPDTVTAEPVTS